MGAGFGDHGSAIGVADENRRPVLRGQNALGCCGVVLQRDGRVLDDADAVTAVLQDLVDAPPAGRFLSPPVSALLDQVGCHASRSMRPRICRKSVGVKWLSASWRMKYRACRMRRPPVLKSRCWRLVRDQFWMATGRTSRRRRLPRL